ncbi:hypothetical protein PVAP13_6NG013000 [Panicum virgatum]|uniref:Uncharacterized protein n=1 Tax=Panicum virgatum TaxID=38727 RepID=A0A8T0QSZ2_PANVG|nr:hypothetical protein PVAP13_6NG013000 [Panicum virgatum]
MDWISPKKHQNQSKFHCRPKSIVCTPTQQKPRTRLHISSPAQSTLSRGSTTETRLPLPSSPEISIPIPIPPRHGRHLPAPAAGDRRRRARPHRSLDPLRPGHPRAVAGAPLPPGPRPAPAPPPPPLSALRPLPRQAPPLPRRRRAARLPPPGPGLPAAAVPHPPPPRAPPALPPRPPPRTRPPLHPPLLRPRPDDERSCPDTAAACLVRVASRPTRIDAWIRVDAPKNFWTRVSR